MILIFTRLGDVSAVAPEWPFGNAGAIGFDATGTSMPVDGTVEAETIARIKLIYVHKRFLGDNRFREFMNLLPENAVAIAHPGGGNRNLEDVITDIAAVAPGVDVRNMLKATYSGNGDPEVVGRLIKLEFANSNALDAHLADLLEYIEEWKKKSENLEVSAIKHKVGEILLPLDIDLQALEILHYTKKQNLQEYFNACFPRTIGVSRVQKTITAAYGLISANNSLKKSSIVFLDLFDGSEVKVGESLTFNIKTFTKTAWTSGADFVQAYAPGNETQHTNLFHEWFKTVMRAIR